MLTLCWDDAEGEHEEDATAESVRERLGALDGRDHTYLSLGEPERHLMCGGDASTGVVLYVQRDDQNDQLVSGSDPDRGTQEVVAAGQPGDYPTRFVVTERTALQAALRFLEHQDLDEDLHWERQ